MEKYKNCELTTPDSRSPILGITIERLRDKLDALELHDGVPEEVHSAFNTARTLFLYGYFYYPFFSVALPTASGVVEMALRLRYPVPPEKVGKPDWRTLRQLLAKAQADGLLTEAGFPHLEQGRREWREIADALEEATGERHVEESSPYVERLVESFPQIRNSFVHLTAHSFGTPAMMLPVLVVSAGIISQLWPKRTG